MASAIVSARRAALKRYRDALPVEVLDRAPLEYQLPYFSLLRTRQVSQRLNKSRLRYDVRMTFELVSDPHDEQALTEDVLIEQFDAASLVGLDLSADGLQAYEMYIEDLEPFTDVDQDEAELHKTAITLLIRVI